MGHGRFRGKGARCLLQDCGAVLEGIGESGAPWVPDLSEEVRGETAEGGSPPNRTSGAASFLSKHGVRYIRATEQDIPRPPETTDGRRISVPCW